MNPLDIEIRAWPPGSYSGKAILAIRSPTGAAVIVKSESTRERNQKLACERLGLLLDNLPWSTP